MHVLVIVVHILDGKGLPGYEWDGFYRVFGGLRELIFDNQNLIRVLLDLGHLLMLN